MGYIKEPEGVDFIIKSKPLTDKQKRELSEFIKVDKKRLAKLANRKTKTRTANNKRIKKIPN